MQPNVVILRQSGTPQFITYVVTGSKCKWSKRTRFRIFKLKWKSESTKMCFYVKIFFLLDVIVYINSIFWVPCYFFLLTGFSRLTIPLYYHYHFDKIIYVNTRDPFYSPDDWSRPFFCLRTKISEYVHIFYVKISKW